MGPFDSWGDKGLVALGLGVHSVLGACLCCRSHGGQQDYRPARSQSECVADPRVRELGILYKICINICALLYIHVYTHMYTRTYLIIHLLNMYYKLNKGLVCWVQRVMNMQLWIIQTLEGSCPSMKAFSLYIALIMVLCTSDLLDKSLV